MTPEPILLFLSAGMMVLALWLLLERRRLRAARAAAEVRADMARQGEAGALRLLRLTAQELRGIGVRLHGHAGHLQAMPLSGEGMALQGISLQAGLAATACQLLDIGDTLQDRAVPAHGKPLLREEVVDLAAEAAEAVTQAQILLGPGLRNWRLPPPGPANWLWVDRRAVRHVLGRVLADAVRNTGHEDWIEISLRAHEDGIELVVEDEGVGIGASIAAPAAEALQPEEEAGGDAAHDSRGIGLRLTLARSLMEAHGGRLEVEAMARVGSRVCLVFPLSRRRAPQMAEPAAA